MVGEDIPLQAKLADLKWQEACPRLKKLCHSLSEERIPKRIPHWR